MSEPEPGVGAPPGRIAGVDAFRVIAVVAVIALHVTSPPPGAGAPIRSFDGLLLVNQVARFAVPFFFAISGYLWGVRIRRGEEALAASLPVLKRLLFLFLAWSLLYLLPYDVSTVADYGPAGPLKAAYWKALGLLHRPVSLLLQGTNVHLWFLEALLVCTAIGACLVRLGRGRVLVALAAGLYVFGLLGKAYADTPFGIHVPFDTRNGPFFGLALFATGYALSGMRPDRSWLWKGSVVALFGLAAHFAEIGILHAMYGTRYMQDYVFGTYFMGLGCSLVALSDPPCLDRRFLARLAPLTLGIYAIHFMFIDILRPVAALLPPYWAEAALTAAVFALSAGAVALMARSTALKPLVT